ncbi:MAG: LPS export ABC transporter periplasmic protein LptC [Gammaproteobacteria bacterium]|nr:LPS export ABC transporter periplasmic protein LptC [Gammaproteobacteria bacterium]
MSYQSTFRTTLLRFFIYGPLLSIAIFGLFHLYKYYHTSIITINGSTEPDLIAKNVDAWQFDVKGQPQYRLISATAQYYNTDNRTNLTVVTGYLYMPTEPYWEVKADTALATNGYETVFLNGHVYIHQAAGKKNSAQTFTTDYLTIYPSKKIAQTDAPITANRLDMVTTSKGAYLDLNNHSVKLHQVYTIYTPSSTS